MAISSPERAMTSCTPLTVRRVWLKGSPSSWSMASGEAPGREVTTVSTGGSRAGSRPTGRVRRAKRPAHTRTPMAITVATGRAMAQRQTATGDPPEKDRRRRRAAALQDGPPLAVLSAGARSASASPGP